ncbi:MAG: ferritin-like domain-containing protein [Verrucomicrobia bacterium]|nr:ferritin-like domain-containing protein [Verrucomicrobiota bacterium]
MKTLQDLLLEELADIYDAEHRLTKALPKLALAASNPELKIAFEDHLIETRGHIERLEQVFAAFSAEPKTKKCEAIVGLLKEADGIATDNVGEPTLDAALISAAQKVEHYEIASYGCLVEWAQLLENEAAAELLAQNLGEEKGADESLTLLARTSSNPVAQLAD